jgi:hypothetical protein
VVNKRSGTVLTSKIINMAEKIKDAEDRLLEALFESPSLADDGFSARVVSKINRQLWFRRLTLPVAAIIGGVIAFKPMAGLVTTLANLISLVPQDLVSGATSSIPQFQTIVLGAILLAVGLVSMRLLEN